MFFSVVIYLFTFHDSADWSLFGRCAKTARFYQESPYFTTKRYQKIKDDKGHFMELTACVWAKRTTYATIFQAENQMLLSATYWTHTYKSRQYSFELFSYLFFYHYQSYTVHELQACSSLGPKTSFYTTIIFLLSCVQKTNCFNLAPSTLFPQDVFIFVQSEMTIWVGSKDTWLEPWELIQIHFL